jgi:predicted RNA polymerase sigma factor
VLFLVFNEGYLATGPGTDPVRHDLTAEAIRLTRLIRALVPDDGEVAGLLALMLLTEARRTARVSASGELVTLAELDGPEVALAAVDRLDGRLAGYYLYHATCAGLLRRLGRSQESRAAYDRAIELAGNTAEIAYLTRRRGQLG